MSTHVLGFQSFSHFLHHFVLANSATSSLRVKLSQLPVSRCLAKRQPFFKFSINLPIPPNSNVAGGWQATVFSCGLCMGMMMSGAARGMLGED